MPGKALEALKKAANLKSSRRKITLNTGDSFEFWTKPLTMAEREKATAQAKSDDVNAFALQLLINKATDQSGNRLFSPGDLGVLKNEVQDADLQTLMLAIISAPEEEELNADDLKSTGKGS